MMRHCDFCAHAGLDHVVTARGPRGWVTVYECPACGWHHPHRHDPMVSAALDEAQDALDASGPLPTVGRD